MSRLIVHPGRSLRGSTRVPGDKSISHRALLLGALADGVSHIEGFLPCRDCLATLSCLRALGIEVHARDSTALTVLGRGLQGLRAPRGPLDCVRSGTTMRLLAGLLAGQPFTCTLSGEGQLLRRPMRRVADPLRRMGAEIESANGCAPLVVHGRPLRGCLHDLAIASAQVKSALLLAGLYATGPTTIRQPGPARDHTERMLAAMGVPVEASDLRAALSPVSSLRALRITVPGDISSAAFPLVAAILAPGSEVTVEGIGVNPTRTGLLDVLRRMGAELTLTGQSSQGNEPVANVTARASILHGVEIGGDTVVRMIDEFPVLAVAATQAMGTTRVRDAGELRVKETDRIATIVAELEALGANITALPDGFVVQGPTSLRGGTVASHNDHRLALALAVAGLIAEADVTIENAECTDDSFPRFVELMQALGGDCD